MKAHHQEADPLRRDELLLAELYSASVAGRVATGQRAGRRIVRVSVEPDFEGAEAKSGRCCATRRKQKAYQNNYADFHSVQVLSC